MNSSQALNPMAKFSKPGDRPTEPIGGDPGTGAEDSDAPPPDHAGAATIGSETPPAAVLDLIFAHDADGRLLAVNPAVHPLLGYSPSEAVKRSISDFLNDDHRRRFQQDYLDPLRERGSVQGSTVCLARDGSERRLQYRAGFVLTDAGPPFVIGSARDMAQLALEEKRLDRLRRRSMEMAKRQALATMAGGLAHEFNNILSVILGNAELAKAALHTWSPSNLFLDEILRATWRARDVIRQLLVCSSLERNDRKPLHLRAVVDEALKVLADKLPGNIRLVTSLAASTRLVVADPTEIHQLVLHLGNHCIRAMAKDGGQLCFSLKEVQLSPEQAAVHPGMDPVVHIELKVQDQGRALTPNELEHLFDPYYSPFGPLAGCALDLAAVRGIVASHQGTITAEQVPGSGTAFTLYFPATEQ